MDLPQLPAYSPYQQRLVQEYDSDHQHVNRLDRFYRHLSGGFFGGRTNGIVESRITPVTDGGSIIQKVLYAARIINKNEIMARFRFEQCRYPALTDIRSMNLYVRAFGSGFALHANATTYLDIRCDNLASCAVSHTGAKTNAKIVICPAFLPDGSGSFNAFLRAKRTIEQGEPIFVASGTAFKASTFPLKSLYIGSLTRFSIGCRRILRTDDKPLPTRRGRPKKTIVISDGEDENEAVASVPIASGSAVPIVSGSAVPIASGSAVPIASGSAVPIASGSAVPIASGSAVPIASGSAVPIASGSTTSNAMDYDTEPEDPEIPILETTQQENPINGGAMDESE